MRTPTQLVRDVEARGGDGVAVFLVDEVDAGDVRVQRERGFLHEGVEDLLQVQRTAERAGGADDGAILQRACRAALVGLQAGVAGRGLVGEQLGELDLLGREVTAGVPADEQDLADVPRQATGTNRMEAMPWCSARPGTIASLVSASGTANATPVLQDAGGAGGPSSKRTYSPGPWRLVAGAARRPG